MKKTINGFRYDTDKARLAGVAAAGAAADDPGWWDAGLYRTARRKRFFLAGRGGPMSCFRRPGPEFRGGEALIPLTPQAARKWAAHYLPPPARENFFPEQEIRKKAPGS
jgi:hypothetical protein